MKNIKNVTLFLIFQFFLLPLFSENQTAEKLVLKNSIPVYVKKNNASEMTAVYMVIKGGVQYLTEETSGLEDAALSFMQMGSKKYSYEELKTFFYKTKGGFKNYSINDGSVFGFECISKYFTETFERFSDSFFNPVFNEKEYNLLMQSYRQNVVQTMNNPESMLFYYINKIVYAQHPYASSTYVTEESLENITINAIKKHYETLLDSRRISFVVSGNVETENLYALLNNSFGKMTPLKTELKDDFIPDIKIKGKPVVLMHENAEGASQVVRVFASPKVSSKDYPVSRLAASIFSDVLYNVVREKYGICYTPVTEVSSSDAPFGYELFYRTTDLSKLSTALDEATSFMENGNLICGKDKNGSFITENLSSRLEGYKNSYINKKYATQATCSGVASRMAASLLQFGDVTSADSLTEIVKNCTVDDVLSVFKKYWLSKEDLWFCVTSPDSFNETEKILEKIN